MNIQKQSAIGMLDQAANCRRIILETKYYRPRGVYAAYRMWLDLIKDRRLNNDR